MAESTKDIPDVDLSPVQEQLEQQEPPPKDEEVPPHPADPKRNVYGQFRTAEDVLKGYKEIQGFSTKVSQENAELKKQLEEERLRRAELEERANIPMPQYSQPQAIGDFDTRFTQNPEEAIRNAAGEEVNLKLIGMVLDEEKLRNPDDFDDRYQEVYKMSKEPGYVHFSGTPTGVRYLFKQAEKRMIERNRKMVRKLFDSMTPEEKAQFTKQEPKETSTNVSGAYMPDTSGLRTGLLEQKPNWDEEVKKHAQKADVDATIETLLRQKLA